MSQNSPPTNVTVRNVRRRRQRTDVSLYMLIINHRIDEAIEMIESGNYNPSGRDGEDNTYLMLACENELTEVALALIDTDNSLPDAVNYHKQTALMIACEKGLIDVALALIQTGNSYPECINEYGETALLQCFTVDSQSVEVLVVELLNTGKSLPNHKDNDGYSALSRAISTRQIRSAIEILKYDPTTADTVNIEGETPLMIATDTNIVELVKPLIQTGKSHPEYIDEMYNTALMNACRNSMKEEALEIINTGKCNQFIRNSSGKTALDYANENNLTEVVEAIKNLGLTEIEININANGFDSEQQESIQIKKYLTEDEENICFKFNNTYFLTNKTNIENQMADNKNIKYKCKQAGDNRYDNNNNLLTNDYTGDDNILYSTKYFSMSSLTGLQILVSIDELTNILSSNLSGNMFCLRIASNAPALISEAYIRGSSGIGADHCQTGKATDIYTLIRGIAVCGPEEKEEKEEKTVSQSNIINVQYKTNTVQLPFQNDLTIGQFKDEILQKLVEQNLLDTITNKMVKLIYKGKLYGNDKNNSTLGSIPDFAPGQTIQAMVSSTTGGKRKTKRRQKKFGKKRYTKKH
jgi:ankyrin repeat protein